jgi:transposase-like protein
VNQRNGYRHRELDTRVGTIDVAIPKLRTGSYFPEWLLERRKRAESALVSVVATCYLLGVSTRRMDKLVQSLGITGLSKSQVSRMAADLDEQVTAFRTRPLADAGPFTFLAADALTMQVREHGRGPFPRGLRESMPTLDTPDGRPLALAQAALRSAEFWDCYR